MRDEHLEKIISEVATPCAWSTPSDLQMAYIVARDVAQAYKAKLAEQEPIMYARIYEGETDWDEHCVAAHIMVKTTKY